MLGLSVGSPFNTKAVENNGGVSIRIDVMHDQINPSSFGANLVLGQLLGLLQPWTFRLKV